MSTNPVPLPHTDTTDDDGGWGFVVAIIGFLFVLSIFTVPYFYDDGMWGYRANYTTRRVQPLYAPVVADGISVTAIGSSTENRSHTKPVAAPHLYPSLASLPVGGDDNVCVHP